jgi:hypothetical protein
MLPSASSRLILAPAGGTAAALLQASGNTGLGAGSVSDSSWIAKSKYKGKTMGYEYFAAHMGVLSTTPQLVNLSTKPTSGSDFYYIAGDSVLSGTWNVADNEKYVIFVNGNLRIDSDITVATGGFISFIVNGEVTVAPGVTQIQGLYVMDGNFVTESVYILNSVSDLALDVQGSVVSWSALSLNRNLGVNNLLVPAEKFSYRSDLPINMPDKMKVFAMQWKEVAAGTME